MNSSDGLRVGRWNQKITRVQKKHLLTFAAGAGENYAAYLKFCETHSIPTFTKAYWPVFVQRNRRTVQAIRQGLIAQIASEAMMDRKARLSLLEDDIARIEDIFSTQLEELTVDQVVKLTDQKRKTLEAIAKERSEWMQEEKPVYENPAMLAMQEAQRRLLAVNVEPVVEGEVREVNDA